MAAREYVVSRAEMAPELKGLWQGSVWGFVPHVDIEHFRPEGSSHRPVTRCRLLHDPLYIHGLFKVEDRYVRCRNMGFQADVYKDSCVELFVQPKPDKGYFNFEFSCGGAMLASYVTDPSRASGRIKGSVPLRPEEGKQVRVYHSLPETVEPEIEADTIWYLEFSIPVPVLEGYVGSIGAPGGQVWRANFYKCGNETSHPHWGSWAPLEERNFHDPCSFGRIRFL